jgi:hypothetical protein
MNIKHLFFLSWWSARPECHEQDGEKLRVTANIGVRTASGDPAMAFSALPWSPVADLVRSGL